MIKFDLPAIQSAIGEFGFDGWLLYDFRGLNVLAQRVLGIDPDVGDSVPDEYTKIFDIVAAARDAAIKCVKDAFAEGRELQGWEVDQASRDVIDNAGYGEFFIHRTGHSIGQETHGNGLTWITLKPKRSVW